MEQNPTETELAPLCNLVIELLPDQGNVDADYLKTRMAKPNFDLFGKYESFVFTFLDRDGLILRNGGRVELTDSGRLLKIELIKAKEKLLYNESDKDIIVKYIENFINPNGEINNGYINTRYACKEAVTGKKFKDDEHADAFYESISAKLVNTGRYTREKNADHRKGYNILINPAYLFNEGTKRSNLNARMIAGAAIIVSLLSTIANIKCKEERPQKIELQLKMPLPDTTIQRIVLQTIDSLNQKTKQIDSLSK